MPVSVVVGDRRFDSKAMGAELGKRGLENGIATKDSTKRFAESWKGETFRQWRHRRAQTEARIGGQDWQVGWAALTHTVGLLADMRHLSGPLPKTH